MAENVCFAILRTTTLQILQSAGFESAHLEPTDVLTDVFCQYMQLLSSTVSAYARLSGRTTGTAWDVMDALKDLALNADVLSAWLEEDGKILLPSWSAQADPGRVLEGIVMEGRPRHKEALVYEYRDGSGDESNFAEEIFDEEEEEEEEEEERGRELGDIPEKSQCSESLTRLPDYILPHFPPFPVDSKDELKTDEVHPRSPTLLSIPPSLYISPTGQSAPLPPPVLVKNRKKPIDNPFTHIISFEDSSLATSSAMALAFTSEESGPHSSIRPDRPKRRCVASSHLTVARLMDELDHGPSPRVAARESVMDVQHVFRQVTEDEATPGNTMFGYRSGLLDEVVRRTTLPIALSNLSSPNMLVDMVSHAPATAPGTGTASLSTSPSPSATSTGPQENPHELTPKASNGSMLAVLASGPAGRHATLGNSTSMPNQQPPTPTPLLTTPPPPPPAKPRPPLAPTSLSALSQSTPAKRKKNPKLTLKTSVDTMPTNAHAEHGSTSTPVSASTPKIRFTIKQPGRGEWTEVKTEPVLPLPSPAIPSAIRSANHIAEMPTNNAWPVAKSGESEVILCLCENPTVDYGAFMIACDECSVWFHGSCVKVAESDQVEEWYCQRCTL